MQKTVQTNVTVCDKCGNDRSCYYKCMKCGADMCYDCQKTHGIQYDHDVFFKGSGDGFWCVKCDKVLRRSRGDAMHSAYLAIANLQKKLGRFNVQFERDRKAAVQTLEAAKLKSTATKK